MRFLTLASACLLLGAAAPGEVPIGKFKIWFSSGKVPLDFASGGVGVHVEALPCPPHPIGESTCGWEGNNNQGMVTVSAPGVTPLSVTTDRQGSYARIAVVRFQARDPRPGVIVESQFGGSGGFLSAQLLIPSGNGYRAVPVERPDGGTLEGELPDFPRDLSGDGRIDLTLVDGGFAHAFGCNACTPRPPQIFTVKDGRAVEESRDPALRGVFAADMARLAPICLSTTHDRNGACAAYVADAARAGRFKPAWAAMLRHYEHGGDLWEPCDVPASAWTGQHCPGGHVTRFEDFPDSLRAFLVHAGYLPA